LNLVSRRQLAKLRSFSPISNTPPTPHLPSQPSTSPTPNNDSPDAKVLLLLRAGKHNPGRWALPGGNIEDGDEGDLRATAKREAAEELGGVGSLPDHKMVGEGFLTK